MKGMALLPSYVITKPNWKTIVQPFLEFYSDEIPSCHTVDSEFNLWDEMWKDRCESQRKLIQAQHVQTVGGHIKMTNTEINKLK